MQIILLEKVVNLGNLGDIVKVKDGYARNFLIPTGQARRATAAAKAEFEAKRARTGKGCCREAGCCPSRRRKAERLHREAVAKGWCGWSSVRFRDQLRHR